MLSNENPCERFTTDSGEHAVSAHRDRLCISNNPDGSRGSYTCASLWMTPTEMRSLRRQIDLAIAETEAYQASLVAAPGADKAD